jgi:ribosomal protein S18 acetylase RimI-like enzyme/predicted transcriptional regulator
MQDLIGRLGPLAFASRLRRLADKLHKDASLIYKTQNIDFQARWFPVMYALTRKKYMAITELARELELTHPAINQIANAMQNRGLLKSVKGKQDERQRFISLSAEGKKLSRELAPIWSDISEATSELLSQAKSDFLESLETIEKALDNRSMFERTACLQKQRQYDKITIAEYNPGLKRYFKSLNYQWLKSYFEIESADRYILENPHESIIKRGGLILFAKLGSKVIGTVASKKLSPETYELTKLAVQPEYQGRQAGQKLCDYAINYAVKAGAQKVVLATSPKLTAANQLYEKLGFKPGSDKFGLLEGFKRKSEVYILELH